MIVYDLFCGLGGWAEGFLAEGWRVVGFDTEAHRYLRCVQIGGPVKRPGMDWSDRTKRGAKAAMFNLPPETDGSGEWEEYPGELRIRDVLTIHGSELADADCIVASPPCQRFSWRAQPWKLARSLKPVAKPEWWRKSEAEMSQQDLAEWREWQACFPAPVPSTELFEACYRIQIEASQAAGRYIPLVIENVKGAQPWVGKAKAHYGSFYLWGDVAMVASRIVATARGYDAMPLRAPRRGAEKVPGFKFHQHESGGKGGSFQTAAVKNEAIQGGSWFNVAHGPAALGGNPRKAASAMIAKIPFELASYFAQAYKPERMAATP